MKKQNKLSYMLVALVLLAGFCFAETVASETTTPPEPFTGSLEVVKTGPEAVTIEEQFDITIKVTNTGSTPTEIYVVEAVVATPISPKPELFDTVDQDYHAAVPPSLTWSSPLAPDTSKTFTYTIKAATVGELSIGPTVVTVPGAKFYSNSLLIDVPCTDKPECDESIGETPITCPEKCGGDPESPPPQAPEQEVIPTPDIGKVPKGPNSPPTPDEQQTIAEKGNLLLVAYAVIALIILGIAYYAYKNFAGKGKKGKKKSK